MAAVLPNHNARDHRAGEETPIPLRDDLYLLPHFEAEAASRGLPANTYAYVSKRKAVLVDAVFRDTARLLPSVLQSGVELVALVLTHRHVVAQADFLEQITVQFSLPVFLHPLDAAHPQVRRAGRSPYADPFGTNLWASLGLRVLFFPGHTEGHIMLYSPHHGGLLLAGDSAVGPTTAAAAAGYGTAVRPPLFFNVDDGRLCAGWQQFDLPLRSIAPYHGVPLIQLRPQAIAHALHSLRNPEPVMTLGEDPSTQ